MEIKIQYIKKFYVQNKIWIHRNFNDLKDIFVRYKPLIAIQASFFLLCLANSDIVTTRGTPPTPVKSTPEEPNRIQSMRL